MLFEGGEDAVDIEDRFVELVAVEGAKGIVVGDTDDTAFVIVPEDWVREPVKAGEAVVGVEGCVARRAADCFTSTGLAVVSFMGSVWGGSVELVDEVVGLALPDNLAVTGDVVTGVVAEVDLGVASDVDVVSLLFAIMAVVALL